MELRAIELRLATVAFPTSDHDALSLALSKEVCQP